MKKFICTLMVSMIVCMSFCGCNRQIIDTTYSYDYAIISLPDGTVVSGDVESWKDYEDGDQIQIKIDGVTYLVHTSDAVLMNK